jgi:putative MATE family efflux protein
VEQTLTLAVGVVDTAMVGRLGAVALASVGIGAQIIFIALTLFSAITTGTTALVARHVGADEHSEATDVARQSLMLGALVALLASITLLFFGPDVVSVLYGSAEPAVQSSAGLYVRIVATTLSFNFMLIVINSILRGAGDTRTPMTVMAVVNLLHIVLDYGLIYGALGLPRLGMSGAPISTAISEVVGALIVATVLFRGKKVIKLSWRDSFHLEWNTLRRVLRVGIPAGIEQGFMRIGQVTYTMIISSLGTVAFAAHQIALNAESFSYMPGFGFSLAATTLVGQGLGAHDPNGAERAGMEAAKLAAVVMSCMGVLFFVLPQLMVGIFTHDPAVISLSSQVLRIEAIAQPALALVMVLSGGLRGAGDTRVIMVITGLGFCCVRIGTAYYWSTWATD